MATPKNKHMRFEDRCIIQEFLDYGHSFSAIARRLNKDRTTIAKEVYNHRFLKGSSTKKCPKTEAAPYVCNGCAKKTTCQLQQFRYDAAVAENEYKKVLSESRAVIHATKEEIAAINEVIAPLMVHQNHSINQVFIEHPEVIPCSKATFYRYIDAGLLNVKNIDLQRRVRFRVKKKKPEIKAKTNVYLKNGRFYSNFRDYMDLHPNASVVEMDTVIGTKGGKGGKCMLTLLFRQFRFMLIFLLPYKRAEYVNKVFFDLKETLGEDEFARLFEVILTDNGTEFSDPETIEFSLKTPGRKLCSVYYCDPNCAWQKGTLEKNHQYIRYVLPKGTSFAGLTQEDCTLLVNHINSVPRDSLNKHSPFECASVFLGKENMDKLGLVKIGYDDLNLSIRLLKK